MKRNSRIALMIFVLLAVGSLACSLFTLDQAIPTVQVAPPATRGEPTPVVVPPTPIVREDGLVAYYPFSGNARDESGNAYHGQATGAQLTTDRFGDPDRAYLFDGIDDYIALPDYLDLIDKDFTISAWVKPDDYGIISPVSESCVRMVLSYRYRAYKNGALVNSGLRVSLGEKKGCGGEERITSAFIGTDFRYNGVGVPYTNLEWFHYTVTRRSELMVIYVNGEPYQRKNVSTDDVFKNQQQPFTTIGAHRVSNRSGTLFMFQGSIDDVRVYNRALSDSEVLQLYQLGGN